MHNSFVFVHRYPNLLLDGYGWILCCSCDASRKQIVEALPNNIQLDPQKDIPYPSCIHILAMEKYLVVYDRKFGIEAKDFIEKVSVVLLFQDIRCLNSFANFGLTLAYHLFQDPCQRCEN
ncbi:uncharacterized protein LOC124448705 [Xenia sp. Carnegie-2017]|uniref:uncharacterized protein LOC124448705 n=1 Tax=Xenia sp. Carnegie-2017 TaxID=2897299 RepID=UPI001F04ED4B|nr:uncharacterized protein LOC124448705 [Xenia sp. Carnegie-2017]